MTMVIAHSDIPGWFSPESVLSLGGILIFVFCALVILTDRSFHNITGTLVVSFCGMIFVGFSSPSWKESRINGFSRMALFRVWDIDENGSLYDLGEEWRLEREVHEFVRKWERRGRMIVGQWTYKCYEEYPSLYEKKEIFAMHSPYSFESHPDPRIRKIRTVDPALWHPACLFWSPFLASLILAPIKTVLFIIGILFAGNALHRAIR